ncbi:T9SS type A sorting domain-containing protein [Salibacter halophilus]|uniref:T9SS type A sorting domain-containing protein n=1 Tax=Salibacter halophilus TaxID=1803916 RepID=A0A6N6M4M9_9FLAO|nr:T9SS type A sorting domain-containing protein [Salibacter halophilus]KAB1064439.1 T9SS type A sorting domain-containing protein [Salibacter halophilus]
MKNVLTLITLLIFAQLSIGQIVQSSCTAHDSIIEKYNDDADRLAVRKIERDSLSYIDNVEIPNQLSDTILNALLAVYNATSIPAWDSVIDRYEIHTFPNPNINKLLISADSSLAWMEQLQSGNSPSAHPLLDSLMTKYNFTLTSYYDFGGSWYLDDATFTSDSNYNITGLINLLDTTQEAEFRKMYFAGDGNDITSTINNDHVELIYSIGWGDCPAGCINRHYWKYKVYFDCRVEFISSYGDPVIPSSVGISTENQKVTVYPNPFNDRIKVTHNWSEPNFTLFDVTGKIVKSGVIENKQINNLNELPSGQYLLKITNSNQTIIRKIIKN